MHFLFLAEEITPSVMFRLIFFVLAFLFILFSFLGWILEVFFRRIFTAKRWINPGFLKGPCLPIYGCGIMSLYVFVTILKNLDLSLPWWAFDIIVIVGIGILMTLIELIAGIIFIEGMHIRLWDYSKRWLNYKGLICPLFSFLWTLAGAGFYYLLFDPITDLILKFLYIDGFELATFIMGIFYGILIIDFCMSMQIVNKIKNFASEHQIVVRIENLKANISKHLGMEKEKARFLSPFKSSHSLEKHMEDYMNDQDEIKEEIHHKKKGNPSNG